MSIRKQGQAAACEERDDRRSCRSLPVFLPLGRRRISAGLSQSFVKRYQWLFRFPSGAHCEICPELMTDIHGPLDRAVRFFIFFNRER